MITLCLVKEMEIGNLIKVLRTSKGIRQAHLAQSAGTSQQYLSHLESGRIKKPSLALMQRIATALNVDLSVLSDAAGLRYQKNGDTPSTLLSKLTLVMPVLIDVIDIRTGEVMGNKIPLLVEHVKSGNIVAVLVMKDWVIEVPEAAAVGEILLVDKDKKPSKETKRKLDMVIYFRDGKPVISCFDFENKDIYGVVVGKYIWY